MRIHPVHSGKRLRVVALTALGLLALTMGCGSGGGTSTGVTPGPTSGFVTRTNEPSFSEDAVILALRVATGAWLSADQARAFDTDINRIRQQVPAVARIRARADFVPRDLLVTVNPGTPWIADWKNGTLATGETALDALLAEYGITSVRLLADYGDGGATLVLRFGQTLNMKALKDLVQAASPRITAAEPNGIAGDGDNITFRNTGGVKTYTFSQGWGDCPAGCIDRHYWDVTLAADNSLSVEERGSPLPN